MALARYPFLRLSYPSCSPPRRRGEETRARADLFHHDDRDGVNAMTAAHPTHMKLLGKKTWNIRAFRWGSDTGPLAWLLDVMTHIPCVELVTAPQVCALEVTPFGIAYFGNTCLGEFHLGQLILWSPLMQARCGKYHGTFSHIVLVDR